ncbi:MAG: SGNH/GDSL hydrolase family protein [Pseudomonadota bacterium]
MSNAPKLDRIVYFGDSLTDSGVFFGLADLVLTEPFPSAIFGYDGQFSNGDVYSDIAPELLGIDVDNFAVGGARAVGEAPAIFLPFGPLGDAFLDPEATPDEIDFVSTFDINLGGQVARFLETLGGGPAPAGTAASIFIGLNDFNAFMPSSEGDIIAEFTILAGDVLSATLGSAGALLSNGVSKVYVNNLLPADFFPAFLLAPPAVQAIGVDALAGYNATLEATAAATFGPAVEIIDLNIIGIEIQNDPTAFGFLNITDPLFFGTGGDPFIDTSTGTPIPVFAQNPALDGLDVDQFAFYDFLHFTTALHGVIGAYTASVIEGNVTVLTDGDDREYLGRGDDLVLAGLGDDVVSLGRGDDIALAGLGDDLVFAGRGDDIVSGGSGDDRVFGGRGDDVLAGGEGDDLLKGGSGRDVLIDGLGSDVAFGGRGSDVFLYTEASLIGGTTGEDHDIFFGGRGRDTLVLALSDETRALVEDDLNGGWFEHLDAIGVTTIGIERFVFVDSRLDLAEIDTAARLAEADLWGLV